ncbi:hypothetical protein [Okeania sp.]|nr:hypothetical protein [Okeania sp.]
MKNLCTDALIYATSLQRNSPLPTEAFQLCYTLSEPQKWRSLFLLNRE